MNIIIRYYFESREEGEHESDSQNESGDPTWAVAAAAARAACAVKTNGFNAAAAAR